MKEFNLQTGKIGEEIAKKYLEKKGYEIVEQNYRTKFGEIDLLARRSFSEGGIVKRGKELVVVEVRTKIGDLYGTPEESLNKKKLRKLWFNAQAVGANRIDAVCIVLKPDKSIERIEHYENII